MTTEQTRPSAAAEDLSAAEHDTRPWTPWRPPAPSARAAGPARPPRQPRRALHGVLLLDKPLGWTSNDVLQKVKNLLRAEKAGHTGTLDPMASGLLPLCFGAATKFSQVSLDSDKTYRATLRLGQTRVGGDMEGEIVSERPVAVDRDTIEAACARFLGVIDQVPPMHSALKHQGRALYEYAREGIDIERPARRITIHRLDIIDWQAAQPETLVIDVCSSKGTYIRTLAEDLGEALGCGAHLAGLRRLSSGPLAVTQAITLEALQALAPEARDALLVRPEALLAEWPRIVLGPEDASRFLCGLRRRVREADVAALRVYGPDGQAFLGSAHISSGELIADRLLSPPEVLAINPAASTFLTASLPATPSIP